MPSSEPAEPLGLDPSNLFRPNAACVVTRSSGEVLAFRRVGTTDAWQFPQGGIDPGETAEAAMWRELEEETGIDASLVSLVHEVPEWLGYEVPAEFRGSKHARGQVQRWFVLFVEDHDIESLHRRLESLPDEEFDNWQWMTMTELALSVIEFRRPIYRRLATVLSQRPHESG